MSPRFLVFSVLCAATLAAQSASPVVGVGPFLHIVSDLDRSVEFYHGTLGLELARPVSDKFTDDPAVAKLYGVPGKQFRAAVLKIPGSEMGIELVQWGPARAPKGEPVAGSGAATLILRRSGAAQSLHDPDGFPVEIEQSDHPGAELSIGVSEVKRAAAVYASTLGAPDRVRFTRAGGSVETAAFPESGQGMLRLFVRDVGALTASMTSAGFSVITTGGEPVTLPQGQRVIILRDPDNFYLQLMQMK